MARLPACASPFHASPSRGSLARASLTLAAVLLTATPALAARPASRPSEAPLPCGAPALHRTAFIPAPPGRLTGACPSLLSTRSLVRPPGIHAL